MSTQQHTLQLVLTYLKSGHSPITFDIESLKQKVLDFFFSHNKKYNRKCIITFPHETRNVDVDLIYKAGLHEIDILLEYLDCSKDFHAGDQWKNIGPDWCDKNGSELSHLWLKLSDRTTLINKAKQSHSDIDIKGFGFGTMPSTSFFLQHHYYPHITAKHIERELMATFLHNQRFLILYACFKHDKKCERSNNSKAYKFVVYYKAISRIIVTYLPGEEGVQLHFVLKHLPFVFSEKGGFKDEKNEEIKEGQLLASDQEYQEKRWERTLWFGCQCNRSFCNINKIGRCSVFKLIISNKKRGYAIIERLTQRCPANTYVFFSKLNLFVPTNLMCEAESFPINKAYFDSLTDKKSVSDIQFNCQFAWNVLTGRSFEVRDQICLKYLTVEDTTVNHWKVFSEKLKIYSTNTVQREALINTLYHMSEMIARSEIFVYDEAFDKLFKYYEKNKPNLELPDGMCFIRRLIITPSRTVCLPPSEHFDNRVIREFHAEHLLRVSIQDDNFTKLTFAVQYHSRRDFFLKQVAGNILNKGINIGPRCYEVLASSNSQLREHGLWMFAKDPLGRTASDIRKWMGDFSRIRNVAKYMARMGQCFSSSEEAVQIELMNEEVLTYKDIKTHDGKYTFSDGIGMISSELAKEIRKKLLSRVPRIDEKIQVYEPSAFQIRFKGCKGMVAENPLLEGRKLVIRPSMEKFQCDQSNLLEIVKISAPRGMFLNRPLISILEQLGIEANVFLKLQKEMVLDLTDSLIYEKKAWKMISNLTTLDYPFKKLLTSGISLAEEPFFRSLLLAIYKVAIDLLRAKARIFILPQYGRNMLGVLDETGTLEYGQLFVQYSKEVGNFHSETIVLERTVVVTKNPCMHPGDVRKFQAVDVQGLHHIKDCIVFPAKGKRPHPDEMAGSDLDGDEYVVMWYDDLIFPRENYPAMDYPANPEIVHEGPIRVPDMIDFMCRYIQEDSIGVLANAHLAMADLHEKGIFSDVCIKIAEKFPQVLDFAKSGTTCHLKSDEKPKLYPDFMEKGTSNNSYKSSKTLGLLYRVTRNLEACVSKIELTNQSIEPDECFSYRGWEHYRDSAQYELREYTKRVQNILKKYGLQNEVEALTGYVQKTNEFTENKYERENAINIARTYILDAIKRFRMRFEISYAEECRGTPSSEKQDIKYSRASAWYMVSYQKADSNILSFPWIVHDYLCEIRIRNLKARNLKPSLPKSSFIKTSDDRILQDYELYQHCLDGQCYCVVILQNTVQEWMKRSALTLNSSADETFCFTCYTRIINNFLESCEQNHCCNFDKASCTCQSSCSPTKLLLEFIKFYASEVRSNIGSCTASRQAYDRCQGFRELNLQAIALRTYASLAITRDTHYIGLNENRYATMDDIVNEEGDPIRVSVSQCFEDLLTHHRDELIAQLKSLSQVKDIFITPDKDHRGEWYILVHSIGRGYQRWCLEELIMDENIIEVLKTRLGVRN